MITNGWRRVVAGALSAAVLAAPLGLLGVVPSGATTSFALSRLAGADRYGTAQAVATTGFSSASTVIMATGENYPDALAASFLAGNQPGGAPILLTTTDDPIPDATLAALSSLKTKNVIIVGGTSAVGDDVATTLSQTASTNSAGGDLVVTRISGPTRYDTMEAIDTTAGTSVGTFNGKKTAFIATGLDFPDALGAGPVSYADKFPVILTDPSTLSSQAQATLATLGIQQVLILGGTAAVSSAVESAINGMGIPTLTRFAGSDRSKTSTLVADYAVTNFGFSNTGVDVASGDESDGGADALASGPLGGTLKVPTIITDSVSEAGSDVAYATEHEATLDTGYALGGTSPLPDAIVQAIETAGGNTGTASGVISLDSTSVAAGGVLGGTVASPSTVSAVTASGCAISSQAVSFNTTTGAFSLTIPTTQAAGTCTLTFAVTFNNGTAAQSDPFTITVTAASGAIVDPVLSSVTLTAAAPPTSTSDSATFTFSQALSTQQPSPSLFRLYRGSGAFATGTGAPTESGGNAWTVSFPEGSVDNVTLASVQAGAVTGTGGVGNYPTSIAVTGPVASLVTDQPDLNAVSAPQQTVSGTSPFFTVQFTFDKEVQTVEQTGTPTGGSSTMYCTPVAPNSTSLFEVIGSSGTAVTEQALPGTGVPAAFTGTITSGSCLPSATVDVTFAGTATSDSLISGAAKAGRVEAVAGDTVGNPLIVQPISGASAAPTYPVLQEALEKYVAGSTTTTGVNFIFNGTPGTPASASDFNLIEGNGAEVAAQALPTATTGNTSALTAVFPSVSLASAVGVAITAGAIPSVPDGSLKLTGSGTSADQVAIPQLQSFAVTAASSALTGPTVTFTFDKAYTATSAPGADFTLYSTSGAVLAAGTGTGTISGDTVTFACSLDLACTSGFTTAQTTGVGAASVEDTSSDDPPIAPEATVP